MLSLVENAACGRDIAERQALIGRKLYRQSRVQDKTAHWSLKLCTRQEKVGEIKRLLKKGKVPQSYQVCFCLIFFFILTKLTFVKPVGLFLFLYFRHVLVCRLQCASDICLRVLY